jgi:hypothetical protein
MARHWYVGLHRTLPEAARANQHCTVVILQCTRVDGGVNPRKSGEI